MHDKSKIVERGKTGNYIKSLYDQRFEFVVQTFNKDYILLDHPLTRLLIKINSKIHERNPQLKGDGLRVYAYSSATPNAVSFGEGTICIMLGLIERLQTEDEVAFVLCHELAHYYGEHTRKTFTELAALNYDKELKSKISSIMNNPYGQYSKLKALFNTLDLSVSRHSRKSEFEADSLGLTYFINAGYNCYAALNVMQILDEADKGLYSETIDVKSYFNFENFPFKDSWAAYKKSDLVYKPLEENGDTLRTHPHCLKRFVKLQQQMKIADIDTALLKKGTSLHGDNLLASFEIINSHYHFKEYGKALFKSLLMASRYPNNPYPHAMIAKSLYQLYKEQKNHNLHAVLQLPDPRFDENYQRFLTFINRLRLHELATLAYEYITTRQAAFYTDEEFISALWMCSKFDFSKVDPEKVREEYEQLFPNGKYLSQMTKP